MLKKILIVCALIFSTSQVNAFDKDKVNLGQSIWGAWVIFNPASTCSENYQFTAPGQFFYQAQKKQLAGTFAIMRNMDKKKLDHLLLDIQEDNGGESCGGDKANYKGQTSGFYLKWVSPTSAELCLDEDAKNCIGLYFNRKEK